jgi:hypothetical protein
MNFRLPSSKVEELGFCWCCLLEFAVFLQPTQVKKQGPACPVVTCPEAMRISRFISACLQGKSDFPIQDQFLLAAGFPLTDSR